DNNDNEEYYTGGLGTVFKLGLTGLGNDLKPGKYEIELTAYAFPTASDGRASKEDKNRTVKLSTGKFTLNVTQEGLDKYMPALCKFVVKPSGAMVDAALEAKILKRFGELEKGSVAKLV